MYKMFALHVTPLPSSTAGLFVTYLVPDIQDKKDTFHPLPAPPITLEPQGLTIPFFWVVDSKKLLPFSVTCTSELPIAWAW